MTISDTEPRHCNQLMDLQYACGVCGDRSSAEFILEALREARARLKSIIGDDASAMMQEAFNQRDAVLEEAESLRAELKAERQLRSGAAS